MTLPSSVIPGSEPPPAADQSAPASDAAPAAVTLAEVLPLSLQVRGWTKPEVAEKLFRHAAAVTEGCIVEIGSYRGRATLALCAGSSRGAKVPVYAVDPHEAHIGVNGGKFGPEDRAAFFRNLLRAGLVRLVRLLNVTSKIAAGGWKRPIALLYIDGDHALEAVAADFAAWRPHLLTGAVVVFGSSNLDGPRRVVEQLMLDGVLAEEERIEDTTFLRFNLAPEETTPPPPPAAETRPAVEMTAAAETTLEATVPDFDTIEGWPEPAQTEELFALASSIRNGCIVEVGCYRGRATIALAAGSGAGAKLPVFALEAKGSGEGDRAQFFRNLLGANMYPYVRVLSTTSDVVAPNWEIPVALLFIEANNRRYSGVKAALDQWRPHLMANALVIFDDTDFRDARRLIDELSATGILARVKEMGEMVVCRYIGAATGLAPAELDRPAAARGPTPLWRPRWFHIVNNVYYGHGGAYMYVPITKCACTTIKAALLEFEGLPVDADEWRLHDKNHNKFPGTGHLSRQQNMDIFQGRTGTYKFVVVRNPFARLASVYADKIRKKSQYWIDKLVVSAAARGMSLPDDISFAEFVDVVSRQEVQEMDPHWRPQFYEGRFEIIKYDFVARMENMPDDLIQILERIGAPPPIVARANVRRNVTGSSLEIWKTVPPETVARYTETFALDFSVLGYPREFD